MGTLSGWAAEARLAAMDLQTTRAQLPRVEWLEHVGSTNTYLRELIDRESDAVPVGTLVATSDQTAGKGRAGRGWITSPGTALACSILMPVPAPSGPGPGQGENERKALAASWLPLLAGSAVTEALQPYFPLDSGMRVGVKWPNDVHVRDEEDALAGRQGKKLCGILCELVSPHRVIVGMGVNVIVPEHELPTERATSLRAAGAEIDDVLTLQSTEGAAVVDLLLADISGRLRDLIALAGDRPETARTRVLRHSLTLGTEVRVHLPTGDVVDGFARTLSADGSLVVDLPTGGQLTVNAGDVEHLR